jgi:CheY-like chemotaxis protein
VARHRLGSVCSGLPVVRGVIGRTEHSVGSQPLPPIKTILLVDDADDLRVTTKWFLANFGYAVDSVRSAEEALALFDPKIHDIVVTDNSMSGMTGAEMAHIIKMRSRSTPVLMFSGRVPEDQSCVDLIILRPAHLLMLKDGVERLLADAEPTPFRGIGNGKPSGASEAQSVREAD